MNETRFYLKKASLKAGQKKEKGNALNAGKSIVLQDTRNARNADLERGTKMLHSELLKYKRELDELRKEIGRYELLVYRNRLDKLIEELLKQN